MVPDQGAGQAGAGNGGAARRLGNSPARRHGDDSRSMERASGGSAGRSRQAGSGCGARRAAALGQCREGVGRKFLQSAGRPSRGGARYTGATGNFRRRCRARIESARRQGLACDREDQGLGSELDGGRFRHRPFDGIGGCVVRGKPPALVVRLPASDASRWRRAGVQAVCFGPQPLLASGIDDFVYRKDFLDCAKIYAIAALDYLGGHRISGS